MVLKTDESEGKILKICIKIKKFLKSLEILFRVWKHIFAKIYFENKKNSESLEMLFRVLKHIFGKNYFENQKKFRYQDLISMC